MILVTGATGTVGSEVVRQVSAAGVPVRALVRDPARGEALAGPGVEIVPGDLLDPASLDSALDGVDKLFLLTAFTPDQETPAANAIAAAQRAGGVHVVRMSVVGASEDSSFATGRGCARTERQLSQSGLDWTVLQPHAFMQNVLGNAGTIATEGALYGTTGEGRIGTVDTRDIASVARTVLTEPGHTGKTYVLTGPESLTHADMAATLAAVLDKEVRYVDVTPDQYEQTLLGYGLPEPLAEDIRVLYGEIFRSGGGDFVTTHVQDVTGRAPRSFEEFVRDHATAFAGG
jgi:uncharacterized protein YbjT (DUF2867 family)